MSKANPTPGPWIVFQADEDGAADVLPAGRSGHIARDIPNNADADIIAAAPDMLAALRTLLFWNEGIAVGRGNHHPHEHAEIARAAIAKAEGRS